MRDYSLSVFFFVNSRDALMSCNQAVSFSRGSKPVENGSGCPIPDSSFVRKYGLLLQACGVSGVHLVSGVFRTAKV